MLRILFAALLTFVTIGFASAQTGAADTEKLVSAIDRLLRELKSQGTSSYANADRIVEALGRIEEAVKTPKLQPLYIFYNSTNFLGTTQSDSQEFSCRVFPESSGWDCRETARRICARYGYAKADVLRTASPVAVPTTEYPPLLISFVCYPE